MSLPPASSPSNEQTQVAVGSGTSPQGDHRHPLQRGDAVGRYTILNRVGSGGMGVVYAAYDPELDRKLAIKLLHQARGSDASTEGRARLVREARAMAKLAHPNVIAVHDVGEHEGRVFVAMEFVDGVTLKRWLADEAHSWQELLEVFRRAGRGLAAAHRKGLVHRDFKPDNVMVGDDGRVRVLDFGLARGRGELSSTVDSAQPAGVDILTSDLTQDGSVMGTPAYMSPEQHAGAELDARSDQFSFCVALYEALYGQRPFAGDTPAAIAVSVSLGEVQAPPAGHKVPGWLRTILLRGIALRPEERFASMDDLLRALARDPTRRRWQLGLGAVALTSLGALLGWQQLAQHRHAEACERAGASIAEVWSPQRAAELESAMQVDSLGYGRVAFDRTRAWLDQRTGEWTKTRTEQCLAAASPSAAAGDRRTNCLDERRHELEQLLAQLESQGPSALSSSIQAAAALTPATRCSDEAWLARHLFLPEDPSVRSEVGQVRRQLAEARASGKLGQHQAAIEAAAAAVESAQQSGWRPVEGVARLAHGTALEADGKLDEAATELRSAFLIATESSDGVTAVAAGGMLAFVAGYGQRDASMGELWRDVSGAVLRQGDLEDDLVGASWRQSIAATYYAAGEYQQMRELYEAAEATRSRLLGPDHPETLSSRASIATALVQLGDFQGARDILEPTVEALAQTLGSEHPALSNHLGTLARVCQRLGDDEAARGQTKRALEIAQSAFGPDHVSTARAMVNHANTLDDERERLRLRLNEAALPALRKAFGPRHPMVAGVLNNIALAHRAAGDLEAAARILQDSLEVHRTNPGPEHPKTAMIMVNLGEVHLAAKRYEEAASLFSDAAAAQDKALGPEHPDSVRTRFRVAQARWELAASPSERQRARELAEQARAGLSESSAKDTRAEIDAWLESHR